MQTTLDLYTDYLLSSFGQTTATGLSRLTDGAVGHDAVTDLLNRLQGDNRTTPGKLLIDGVFFCYTLEDIDQGLHKAMPLTEIQKKKINHQTAIPRGRYEVAITFSNRFQAYMPLLLNVPGFEGIRIHYGNRATDSSGCPLVGNTQSGSTIGDSRRAYAELFKRLKAVEKKEKIWIEIQ